MTMDSALALIPGLFGIVFAGILALVIILVVKAAARERERRARLHAYAAQLGWHPIAGPVPDPVAEAIRSRRTKLALGTRYSGHDTWVVWHQWTESSGSDSSTSSTKNLTRYYVWLGPGPDVRLVRRSSIGAFFKPVRGVGTGDEEFDRRFVIKPTDRPELTQVVTPAIRQAMLAGHFVDWQITRGTLILAFWDTPKIENLQPRADGIVHLTRLLTNG
ncbi:MAG: hypothetical protein ACRDOO_07155 [Actinomadura sp.]